MGTAGNERSASASRVRFFGKKRLTQSDRFRIIVIDDTRSTPRDAANADGRAAGDRGASSRLADRADGAPQQRLYDLRRRRGAPALGFNRRLCRRPDPPVQPARRTGWRSAPLAWQLPPAEG